MTKEGVKINKSLLRAAAVFTSAIIIIQPMAFAAPKTMSDGATFDAEYYAENNPDVKAVFGTDEDLLYQHYVMFGKAEGRLAVTPSTDIPSAATSAISDELITNRILSLKEVFPEGTPCTNAGYKYNNYPIWPSTGAGCAAFGMQVSDLIYGYSAKVTYDKTVSAYNLKPGDYVRTNEGTYQHSIVVISTTDTTVTVCEGNYGGRIHWGRVIPKSSLAGKILYVTRRG